ncbi:MAG: coproporphyrinogen III oxidase [Gammaproteobacteria bacterium RIFCSPHIGHO2_12_FULL_38_11]|nr:MAG: coproporphyrinogen III oxidase [Gammaproteobacteria bacterium RIFCSPHIGHO2_12_FULL_38_11]
MTLITLVKTYLFSLQDTLCDALQHQESEKQFRQDLWTHEKIGGGRTRILENGAVIERAGVNFSHVAGDALPPAATLKRPDLMGAEFEALGVSSVIHPRNPFVPTAHLNVRYFQATKKNGEVVWWFGGGYDLTPYYGFDDDCVHWHKTAKKACDQFHPDYYSQFKKNADEYFYLKHRKECRGIGGLFFDDLNALSFEDCFSFQQAVGNSFMDAYIPIVEKRKTIEYTQQHRDFQSYRRGRYVEFNLVFDRGTLFGLQFGGRTEAILMSLPPVVNWIYDFVPSKNSLEEKLTNYYLKPREWVVTESLSSECCFVSAMHPRKVFSREMQ